MAVDKNNFTIIFALEFMELAPVADDEIKRDFRVAVRVAGGHVHCRVFVAANPTATGACCGEFTVRRGEEFHSLMAGWIGARFFGGGTTSASSLEEACKEFEEVITHA